MSENDLPLLLIDHLREVKRFYAQGSKLLDELCPDDDLDMMRRVLKKRRSQMAMCDSVGGGASRSGTPITSPIMERNDPVARHSYHDSTMVIASLPPPPPIKPSHVRINTQTTLNVPPPPTMRPPVAASRPLSRVSDMPPPRVAPPTPPCTPGGTPDIYDASTVVIDGLSLEHSAIVQLMRH